MVYCKDTVDELLLGITCSATEILTWDLSNLQSSTFAEDCRKINAAHVERLHDKPAYTYRELMDLNGNLDLTGFELAGRSLKKDGDCIRSFKLTAKHQALPQRRKADEDDDEEDDVWSVKQRINKYDEFQRKAKAPTLLLSKDRPVTKVGKSIHGSKERAGWVEFRGWPRTKL